MATRRYSDGYRKLQDVDTPRRIAFDVLMAVETEDAFANIALTKALRDARSHERLDSRDAAFTSELVNGSLRAQGRLDWVLGRYLTRPIDKVDTPVRVLLRMGAHQLLNMRVADHAAVASTVDLARHYLTEGPTRMVNAVLRSITREAPGAIEDAIAQISDANERRSIEFSHPRWMVDAFEDALIGHGFEASELDDLLAGDNRPPLVTLVARPGLIAAIDLAEEAESVLGTRVAPGDVSDCAVLLEHGDPGSLDSIRSGRAGVQDEGSQLSAMIAATAPIEGKDDCWLDLCAGPGGKASMLASIGALQGATLIANEVHPHRARLVERACRQLDNVEVVSSDGRTFGGAKSQWSLGSFDRVVIDAPCSGMGSMRRRPESRWRRTQADVGDLVDLQAELLARGLELVREGGILTYITCSPHVDETLAQVEKLLKTGKVELLDTVALGEGHAPEPLNVPDPAGRIKKYPGRTLQLWEHRNGTDLMFIAAMKKVEKPTSAR